MNILKILAVSIFLSLAACGQAENTKVESVTEANENNPVVDDAKATRTTLNHIQGDGELF